MGDRAPATVASSRIEGQNASRAIRLAAHDVQVTVHCWIRVDVSRPGRRIECGTGALGAAGGRKSRKFARGVESAAALPDVSTGNIRPDGRPG